MQVRFDEIPQDGLWFEITDQSWVPKDAIEYQGSILATVHLERKEQERVFIKGTLSLELVLTCDRCLERYISPLEATFSADVEYVEKREWEQAEAEHSCSSNEMDMIFVNEPLLDIHSVLEQQLFLLVPEKKICREDCQGLCTQCGANLNSAPCDCDKDVSASPFSVLAKLKDK